MIVFIVLGSYCMNLEQIYSMNICDVGFQSKDCNPNEVLKIARSSRAFERMLR